MSQLRDVIWKDVWIGYLIGLVGTAVLGGIAFLAVGPNMWWLATASAVALLAAGFRLSRRTGRWEGLSATLVTVLYYLTATAVLIIGMMYEVFPDPLPGLPKGDSTFFFVWPLTQLISTLVGASLGARSTTQEAREVREASR